VHGTPIPVLDKVASKFDVSRRGMLVYRRGGGVGELVTLQWLDDEGKAQPLPAKPGLYSRPHLSPDGKLLVLNATSGGKTDLWIYDWQRDSMTRLTFGDGFFTMPVWSPDGRFVAFKASGRGIFWIRADGTTKPQPLSQSKYVQSPFSFSPDGKWLAYAGDIMGKLDLWTLPVKNEGGELHAGKPEAFLNNSEYKVFPAFSPDGRWIAYMSRESGSSEILRAPPRVPLGVIP
jgi:Tol biopolymer transport system component